jgi:hypothetical protein
MSSQLVTAIERRVARRSIRPLALGALGPTTVIAGFVWAFAQPYRITLLHPRDAGFWDLLVQPPLLVIAVGFVFALVVVPGLLDDLERSQEEPPQDDAAAR